MKREFIRKFVGIDSEANTHISCCIFKEGRNRWIIKVAKWGERRLSLHHINYILNSIVDDALPINLESFLMHCRLI